jgi:S1-C subfamily serine protease
LIDAEKNTIPGLGLFVLDMDDEIAKMIPGLRKQYGAVVAGRMTDAPFWASYFQAGDVIHSINGKFITTVSQLREMLGNLKSGSAVAVQIERQGRLSYVTFETE